MSEFLAKQYDEEYNTYTKVVFYDSNDYLEQMNYIKEEVFIRNDITLDQIINRCKQLQCDSFEIITTKEETKRYTIIPKENK